MSKEKIKKPIFKRWWFWVIIIILVIGIGANMGGNDAEKSSDNDNTNKTSSSNDKANDNDSKKETKQTSSKSKSNNNNGTISKSEFSQINDGMTYDQVVKIIGSKGTLQSESGSKGDAAHTQIYFWDGDSGWGANANITFQNEKVINKAQFGVDGGSKATIDIDKFNKIQNGMSYNQVKQLIGGDGSVTSESGQKGTSSYTVIYTFNGKSLGSNAILTFQGDKLIDKSQFGLK